MGVLDCIISLKIFDLIPLVFVDYRATLPKQVLKGFLVCDEEHDGLSPLGLYGEDIDQELVGKGNFVVYVESSP